MEYFEGNNTSSGISISQNDVTPNNYNNKDIDYYVENPIAETQDVLTNIAKRISNLDITASLTASDQVQLAKNAGSNGQGSAGVAIGSNAATNLQGVRSVAIGSRAGCTRQGAESVAIGAYAGQLEQNAYNVAVGSYAGECTQGSGAVAIGTSAGNYNQQLAGCAFGYEAGYSDQGAGAIAIGYDAGVYTQGQYSISIGPTAGYTNQSADSIAIGSMAAEAWQGQRCVAIGYKAGNLSQHDYAIAIGYKTGMLTQGQGSIAIGQHQGRVSPGDYSVFIGPYLAADNIRTEADSITIRTRTAQMSVPAGKSKTFVIQHPLEQDCYLVHACLEGPEAGVYYRGKECFETGKPSCTVYLPDYVRFLATRFSIHITPLLATEIYPMAITNDEIMTNGSFTVSRPTSNCSHNDEFYWIVYGLRETVQTTVQKDLVHQHGQGPYTYLTPKK